MDCWLLNLLMKQAIFEINNFVPEGYLNPWRTTKPVPFKKTLSITLSVGLRPDSFSDNIVAIRASELGAKLLRQMVMMTARQYVVCKLLIPLGELIVIEINEPTTELDIFLLSSEQLNDIKYLSRQRPYVINNFQKSLKKYLEFLTEQEAKPFASLLESAPGRSESQIEDDDDEGRQIQQEKEILRIICDVLKHDPQKLPPVIPGKPWVKSDVRRELNIPRQPFQSEVVFKKAWERLRNNKQIKSVTE